MAFVISETVRVAHLTAIRPCLKYLFFFTPTPLEHLRAQTCHTTPHRTPYWFFRSMRPVIEQETCRKSLIFETLEEES